SGGGGEGGGVPGGADGALRPVPAQCGPGPAVGSLQAKQPVVARGGVQEVVPVPQAPVDVGREGRIDRRGAGDPGRGSAFEARQQRVKEKAARVRAEAFVLEQAATREVIVQDVGVDEVGVGTGADQGAQQTAGDAAAAA